MGALFASLFQSAPPSRAAAAVDDGLRRWQRVSIRAALTGGGEGEFIEINSAGVSIRAALTGGGPRMPGSWMKPKSFNPRRPHGRRHDLAEFHRLQTKFQSAPPSRAAAADRLAELAAERVSIRAALTGGGASRIVQPCRNTRFNPRRPHGRRPPQSEPSNIHRGFNPRRPHGRRRAACARHGRHTCFNPRRPHGRRPRWQDHASRRSQFQSAPPSRAAAARARPVHRRARVSIRAALTGGGWLQDAPRKAAPCFNPRRPHGRRQDSTTRTGYRITFQSAPPSRAAALALPKLM